MQGKTAVITGASRGLGAGLARHFAGKGMRLALCSRSKPVLDDGGDVLATRLDVTDEKAFEHFGRQAAEHLGHIDLWINNAGVLDPIAPLRDVTSDAFRRHVDINLFGVFLGTRMYARHIRAADKGGVLINISSGASQKGYAGWSAYCAGKGAIDRLTEAVQLEEVDAGLRAHAVAPGVIDTDMQAMIRDCSADQFPMVQKFLDMKRDDAFNTTDFVAEHLLDISFGDSPPDEVVLRLPAEKG